MNYIDYIVIALLILCALRGFKEGLLPTLVNFISTFLVFVIAFYLKQPISTYLYENMPFLPFGGIFKGITAINILFYEAIAYFGTFLILGIIFSILKRVTKIMDKLINVTLFLSLPSKLLAMIIGLLEGILFSFILLQIGSVVNATATKVNESISKTIILEKVPIINTITKDMTNSVNEIYNTILKNKNDTNVANKESIEILLKYNILTYDSAKKLVESDKLDIDRIDEIIEKYKENNNVEIFKK